jgi:hypothetical protein
MKYSKSFVAVAALLASIAITHPAIAVPVTFTGTSGSKKATAEFDVSGSTLIVTLTNSSTYDVMVPTDVLTGVFFNIPGNPTLTKISAKLAPGSVIQSHNQPLPVPATDAGGGVGGEWGYLSGLSANAPYGANQGISSAGYGTGVVDFGPGTVFPGTNLQGPAAPNGLQYGIVSAGDNPATGNTPVTGGSGGNHVALIKNSVIFELGGLPVGFELSSIGSVSFQYGTSLREPNVPGNPGGNPDDPGGGGGGPGGAVPEPSTLALFGIGLVAMGFTLRNRFAKAKTEAAE